MVPALSGELRSLRILSEIEKASASFALRDGTDRTVMKRSAERMAKAFICGWLRPTSVSQESSATNLSTSSPDFQ